MKNKFITLLLMTALIVLGAGLATSCFAATSSDITISYSEAGQVRSCLEKLTVEDLNSDGKTDIDEAFIAYHKAKCESGAEGYEVSQGAGYEYVSKFMGQVYPALGYFLNDEMAYGLNQEVKTGDFLSFFTYQDTAGYSDRYTYFDKRTAETTAGKAITLKNNSVYYNASYETVKEGTSMVPVLLNGQVFDQETKPDGTLRMIFNKPGTYTVAIPAESDGVYYVPSACVITVKPAAAVKPESTAKPVLMGRTYAYKTKMKLKWSKVKGADGYQIYAAPCGKTSKLKLVKTLKSGSTTSYTVNKLKKGKSYKFQIKAYKKAGKEKKNFLSSYIFHAATTGGKYTNPSKVKTTFDSAVIRKGNTRKISASIVKANSKKRAVSHVSKFRYKTSDKGVATVNKSGKIRAVGKGKCSIYVCASNGAYKKISVTVK